MCTGQIFFKKTAIYLLQSNVYVSANNIVNLIVSLLKVPYFFLALVIYACATFLWLFILQKVQLSVAYPFTALAMVIIPHARIKKTTNIDTKIITLEKFIIKINFLLK